MASLYNYSNNEITLPGSYSDIRQSPCYENKIRHQHKSQVLDVS